MTDPERPSEGAASSGTWRTGRTLLLVLLATLAALAGCVGSDGADPLQATPEAAPRAIELPLLVPGTVLGLEPDVPVSWVAPTIRSAMTVPGLDDGCDVMPQDPCVEYPLVVPEGTRALRAALDRPDHRDVFVLWLLDPAGEPRARAEAPYTMEARVAGPEPGTWTLRVQPGVVEDATFRLRVQAVVGEEPRPEGPWLPNARPLPPWDLRFDAPADGSGATSLLPPVPAGLAPSSCTPEEWVLNGYAPRCLRFSFGWGNDGDGDFHALIGEAPPGSLTAPVTQRVHASDGSFEDRPAGTATVHAGHGHYHLDDVFHVEALRVEDGALLPAVVSAKRGSCTLDYALMDWTSWAQDPQWSSGSDCMPLLPASTADPTVDELSVTRGWADVYNWELADNYVDFTGQPDGEYVLRATIDRAGAIAETDESDNVGYTHILVQGSAVEVLERGYGRDPWDPEKRVIPAPWVV